MTDREEYEIEYSLAAKARARRLPLSARTGAWQVKRLRDGKVVKKGRSHAECKAWIAEQSEGEG